MKNVCDGTLREMKSSMQAVAKTFGKRLDVRPGNIGAAFSANAKIVNAEIAGIQTLSDAQLKAGADLLLFYLATPKAMKGGINLRPGYYLVRAWVDVNAQRGRCVLLDKKSRKVASPPLTVERIRSHRGSVSGSFSRCHVTGDVVIRKRIMLTVTVRWCK